MESTASSPRGAKRSRTRRSSDEEGGTLCEVKLEETVIVPNLLIQTQKTRSIPEAMGHSRCQVALGSRSLAGRAESKIKLWEWKQLSVPQIMVIFLMISEECRRMASCAWLRSRK